MEADLSLSMSDFDSNHGDMIEPQLCYWTFIARFVDPTIGEAVRPILVPAGS